MWSVYNHFYYSQCVLHNWWPVSILKSAWERLYWIAKSLAASSLLEVKCLLKFTHCTAKWKEAGTGIRQGWLGNTVHPATHKISIPKIWHVNTGLPWLYERRGSNEWDNSGPFFYFSGVSDPWFICKIHSGELNHDQREKKTPGSEMTASRSHVQLPFAALHCGMGK